MAPEAVERARGRASAANGLATAGGALLLLLALAAALFLTSETVARYGWGGSLMGPDLSQSVAVHLGIGFAAASLLALPAALTAPFRSRGEPPLRSHSALALVPGCLLAVPILLAAVVALAMLAPSAEVGLEMARRSLYSVYSSYTFAFLPLAIMVAAALSGPDTPESAAAAAAPIVLVALSGIVGELSITGLFLATLVPLLVAAMLLAILYAGAPAVAVTPWLVGIALAFGMALLTATGFLTPSEAMGLVALFSLPIALIVRALALRQALGAMLRHAAMETVSVVAALAAGVAAAHAIALSGVGRDLGGAGASRALLATGAVAFAAACYVLTPVLVLCLGLPIMLAPLRTTGIEPMVTGAVMVLLGLAATLARAGRRAPAGAGLPPLAAVAGAAVFAALAALVAFVPAIALAPVRSVLQ